jgi:hypothetical protein
MMTGIPPPRYFDFNWQISRMNDKGFSKDLRDIVEMMLEHKMRRRPDTMSLVDRAEDGWRHWRTSTREGQEYVDAADEFLGNVYSGSKTGSGLMNIVGK